MQIIVVSRHLKAARTINIMPRHLVMVALVFLILVFSSAAVFSWLSVRLRLPLVEEMLTSLEIRENQKNRHYLENNLQLMATRLGELQARVLQLDTLGERLSGAAGVRLDAMQPSGSASRGRGGPFKPESLSATELLGEIDRLSREVSRQGEDFEFLEFALQDQRVKDRLLPTTLPISNAQIGSTFGYRQDPIIGVRALHEGYDFVAEVGAPVFSAADGVVLFAGVHPEYGNVIDVDHGEGLVSRYAHLSSIKVQPGALVKRGARIGAVGNTGRSTGPHLHFEVRLFGVAKNPALFLRQNGQLLAHSR